MNEFSEYSETETAEFSEVEEAAIEAALAEENYFLNQMIRERETGPVHEAITLSGDQEPY